jgi:hypothetical protein
MIHQLVGGDLAIINNNNQLYIISTRAQIKYKSANIHKLKSSNVLHSLLHSLTTVRHSVQEVVEHRYGVFLTFYSNRTNFSAAFLALFPVRRCSSSIYICSIGFRSRY